LPVDIAQWWALVSELFNPVINGLDKELILEVTHVDSMAIRPGNKDRLTLKHTHMVD
jgi:hypothetical protein